MNQYGVKLLHPRYGGKGADNWRQQQMALIDTLRRAPGSQANHRARRRHAQFLQAEALFEESRQAFAEQPQK